MLIKEELPLDARDIRQLRLSMLPMLVITVLIAVFLYLVARFIFSQLDDSSMKLVVQGIFLFAGLLFVGINAYTVWSRLTDIRGGVKEHIEGKITDKRTVSKVNHTGGPGTNTERTRGRKHYYIKIEGTEFRMSHKHYLQTKVGERIVIERTPRSGFIFSLKKV